MNDWLQKEHGMDNLKGITVVENTANVVKYESVHVQLAAVTKQRDEAWIEVAQCHDEIQKLKSILAHYQPPDSYPKHAMPERKE